MRDSVTILQEHGIQPSAQRVAVADYVLKTLEHPSADLVWNRVKASVPYISRATVYNTLNLFVAKGLLRALTLGVTYLNDSSLHQQMVRFATVQLRAGHLPLTSWFPFLGEGSPQFLHYQSLPAIVTGLVTVQLKLVQSL